MKFASLAFIIAVLHACTSAPPPSAGNAAPSKRAAPDSDAIVRAAAAAGPNAQIVSRDAAGQGKLLIAPAPAPGAVAAMPADMTGEAVARVHLMRHAARLGTNRAALRDAVLEAAHTLPGGAAIYQFGQRSRGYPVFHARASVLVDARKNLVSLANNLVPSSVDAAKSSAFRLSPEAALQRAYAAAGGKNLPAGAVEEEGVRQDGWRDYRIATSPTSLGVLEASARRVMFRANDRLVPAFHVELLLNAPGGRENVGHGFVIAAADGGVLWKASLTSHDAFTYRVWAEPDSLHTPTDGPIVDITPHPTGMPDSLLPGFVPTTLVTLEGFNKNPQGAPDPWLAANATYAWGNNVRAYSDRNQFVDDAGVPRLDGFNEGQDLRADLTSSKTFDRTFDPTKPPDVSDDQIKAAITQLFYVTNWEHDFWYDSGFNEAAKNAQLSNYGRGGAENDPMRAEAQDSASSGAGNNANMYVPSDGRSPRMQMYVWNGLPNRTLETQPAVSVEDGIGAASFGEQMFDLGGPDVELVLTNDGSTELPPDSSSMAMGTTSDACQEPQNVAGKIAVIDRGACLFVQKAENAEAAGALAALLLDNAPGHNPPNPSSDSSNVEIPMLALSFEDGQKLKAALADGRVFATKFVRGEETKRDGTIDNTVVAHEWGHYLHHRLVLCGSLSCDGMSEGWADFNALMLVIRDGDTFDGKAYALSQYAGAGLSRAAAYFGIRRAPYSTDPTKNPFTFTHIRQASELPETAPLQPSAPDMSEAHNVGEIWSQTLFDAYTNLIAVGRGAGLPFDQIKRRMADYLVAGMKAAPIEPTFVEQRDALLSSVRAIAMDDSSRAEDFMALARGFAKRGLGSGAIAPPTSSETLDEAVESFEVKGNLLFDGATLDDSVFSCDDDGYLDAGESGVLKLSLSNRGWTTLSQAKVKVSSADPNITFASGAEAELGALPPYAEVTANIGVSAAPGAMRRGILQLTITPSDPDALEPTHDVAFALAYNFDDALNASTTDDVESERVAWTYAANLVPDVWSREGDAANHVWHGDDIGTQGDESLVSPDLQVSRSTPLSVSFRHRYSFEAGQLSDDGDLVYFDGGVLEVSEDGGASWHDVSEFARFSYPITLVDLSQDGGLPPEQLEEYAANPLAGRRAFGGESQGYPNYARVSINFGTAFAGKTIKLRFRLGSDEGAGAPGWDIDDIAFSGGSRYYPGSGNTPSALTNKPFASVVDDATSCTPAPQ